MAVVLGVDPGATGAAVWLGDQGIISCVDHSAWVHTHDPAKELHTMLKTLWPFDIAVVEAQHARKLIGADGKLKQGIASTWNYAEHYGIIKGVLASFGKPVHLPDPAVWKASMHVSSEKATSLELARTLWPQHTDMFALKKHHGRAEAALIAYYGRRFLPFEPMKKRVL